MAFDKKGLQRLASHPANAGGTFNLYVYCTNDAAATVEADAYFDGALDNGLNKGDIILASMVRNGTAVFKQYGVTAGGADVGIIAF